jgi:hypothetical protein
VEDIFMNQKQTFRPELPKYDGQTAYKRQLAYAELGIDPRDVQHLPFLRTSSGELLESFVALISTIHRRRRPVFVRTRIPSAL